MTKPNITYERLHELMVYYPETGVFFWKVNKGAGRAGDMVGSIDKETGYAQTSIDKGRYRMHRLAYLYVHGYMPENEIDHKNRIKFDNKISNLREVTRVCNVRNKGKISTNKSGVTGVSWSKSSNKWLATITSNKNQMYLGVYSEFNDAVMARWKAEVKHEFPNCNTCSLAYNHLKERNLVD